MDTTENESSEICRFSEREKRFDGLRALERHKAQVSQQGILEQAGPIRAKEYP